jgi:hypothetical protein
MTQAGSPNPRNDRICITSSCPRQFVYSRRQQQLRFSVPLAANHNRPSHPCDLVGKCNCRHLCWSAIHYSCEPKSFRSVLSGVANDGHSAGDKQPSRFCLDLLARQYLTLVAEVSSIDKRIHAWHRSCEESRRLEEIPGVGPIVATALVAEIGDWEAFRSGRSLAAWIVWCPSSTRPAARNVAWQHH